MQSSIYAALQIVCPVFVSLFLSIRKCNFHIIWIFIWNNVKIIIIIIIIIISIKTIFTEDITKLTRSKLEWSFIYNATSHYAELKTKSLMSSVFAFGIKSSTNANAGSLQSVFKWVLSSLTHLNHAKKSAKKNFLIVSVFLDCIQ